MRIIFLSTLLLLITLISPAQSPERTLVWESGKDGVFAHFVYGLTVTGKGTVLAVAEARIAESADDGAHHIALRRSTDGGRTFAPSQFVVKSEDGQSWANPVIVEDAQRKRLFLFYALNHRNDRTELFYKTSRDDGRTWSKPVPLTHLFANAPNGWTFHLPGPGHGIQLKNGRLLMPVWHRRSIAFPAAERHYGVACVYSDDHGKTWKAGGATAVGQMNESQAEQLPDGSVLLIARTRTSRQGSFQAKAVSRDGGQTWQDGPVYDTALTGSVCDIGMIRVKDMLLVSQPADPSKRRDLTIRLSHDGGQRWPVQRLLQPGGATYSDLAVLPDQTILCLYGHGGARHMPDSVSLARFPLSWLTEPKQ